MDNLTREFLEKDAVRMAKMLAHLKIGHTLNMSLDPVDGKVYVYCETGVDQLIMHRLLHEDLPGDTCVDERGEEWRLDWEAQDTYAHHTGEDFKAS